MLPIQDQEMWVDQCRKRKNFHLAMVGVFCIPFLTLLISIGVMVWRGEGFYILAAAAVVTGIFGVLLTCVYNDYRDAASLYRQNLECLEMKKTAMGRIVYDSFDLNNPPPDQSQTD